MTGLSKTILIILAIIVFVIILKSILNLGNLLP